jgi:hypothetical protein
MHRESITAYPYIHRGISPGNLGWQEAPAVVRSAVVAERLGGGAQGSYSFVEGELIAVHDKLDKNNPNTKQFTCLFYSLN